MRPVISFAAACVVTLALFYLMHLLISREVPDPDRPVQTTDIRLVTLRRASGAGAGADAGERPQPPISAPTLPLPSGLALVVADSNLTRLSPLFPPIQVIVLPSPAVAPVAVLSVHSDPPVTVAKKPVLQAKSQPGEPKTPIPPPIRKNTKQSPISKKPPAALPATPPAKPSLKPPAKPSVTPQKELQPKLQVATR